MSKEIMLLIVGASISLISSLVGFLAQVFIQLLLKNKGKVKIYIKKVYSKVDSKPWGFFGTIDDMTFSIPLWIELHNTKDKREVVRNLNLKLYYKNKEIGKMKQINHYNTKNTKESFANNGNYSFILEPATINKFDLFFMIKKSEIVENFDQVKITYYDSKDKYYELPLIKVETAWKNNQNKSDNDWVSIN